MEVAASLLSDFQKHYNYGASVPRHRDVKWRPPTADTIWKTNFDGAMFSEFEEARIGAVVRNQAGQVMAALSEKIKKSTSVETRNPRGLSNKESSQIYS